MSFTAIWLWTLGRSLLLIALALPWCGLLVRWIRTSPSRRRGWQLGLLTVPVLFPELLTGYAYSQMTRLLITGFWTRELWFDLLLLLRVIPIGTLLWYCSPASPLSREAWHARRLALRPEAAIWKRFGILAWYWLQGPARTALFAACGLFLVLFQEFELASLLATTSWTVWLFDAQAGGLSLNESLKCAVAPACCSWLLCGTLIWMVSGKALRGADHSAGLRPPSILGRLACWAYLFAALGLIVVYPCVLIGGETLAGIMALASNTVQARGLLQGILVAGGFGLISGYTADLVACWLMRDSPKRVLGQRFDLGFPSEIGVPLLRNGTRLLSSVFRRSTPSTACPTSTSEKQWHTIPNPSCDKAPGWQRWGILGAGVGLCGSLIIGLFGVALFQLPGLRLLYDTPLPLVLGLIIWLLPRAILLHGMLRAVRSPMAEYAARLLFESGDPQRRGMAYEILWQLHGRSATVVRLLLCHWAYWELTLPGVLTPTGLEPAPMRLYIDMHFSRNALLTAKAGVTLVAPLLLVAICWRWLKKGNTAS